MSSSVCLELVRVGKIPQIDLWTMLEISQLHFPEVKVLRPPVHRDGRGVFVEVYNRRDLEEVGITTKFVQDNVSFSTRAGTVRGLHFQIEPALAAKLVRVVRGAIFDVVVDLRVGSPTFGGHAHLEISDASGDQIFIPVGFAHGFCTLEPNTEVAYKVSEHWSSETDRGLRWNDPDLGIAWPVDVSDAVVSEKDRRHPALVDLPEHFFHESGQR
jgi:dTDP-4-dehydrorhamnose 3,5-epimerase